MGNLFGRSIGYFVLAEGGDDTFRFWKTVRFASDSGKKYLGHYVPSVCRHYGGQGGFCSGQPVFGNFRGF